MPKKPWFSFAFFSWMVIITMLSLAPFSGNNKEPFFRIPHLDKIGHFTFYFIVVVLGYMFLWEHRAGKIRKHTAIIWISFFAIIYGMIIELIQSEFTTSRSGDLYDILANTVGAIVAALALKFVFFNKRGLKWKN